MTIRFHLLDALEEISPGIARDVVVDLETARDRVSGILPVDKVDVVVAPSPWVIPEYGLNGFAHGKGRVTVSVDPSSPRLEDPERGVRLLGTLAHELHHVARMRGGQWGRTLGGRLVAEGLAQCFEEEAGAPTPFYAVSLDRDTLARMAARALPLVDAKEFDHNAWFFGRRADPEWPRNTGYSLGYAIVKSWLNATGGKASTAVDVPDAEFIDEWVSGRVPVV